MNIEKMSYKDYTWKFNPSQISIEEEKNIKEHILPFANNAIQNLGRGKRIVKGIGEFFGDNRLDEFKKLRNLYLDDSCGYLKIPGTEAFLASFKQLKMSGNGAENSITYSFEFWENIEDTTNLLITMSDEVYIANLGDSLWSISNKYNISIEKLISLNPDIKRPDNLLEGQEVVLR